MTIVQPKAGGVKTWSTNRQRLGQFAQELIEAAGRVGQAKAEAEILEDGSIGLPDRYLKTGDWCRYCPAIVTCPAQAEKVRGMAVEAFDAKPSKSDGGGKVVGGSSALGRSARCWFWPPWSRRT